MFISRAAAADVARARLHRRANAVAARRRHAVGRHRSIRRWSAWIADVAWHLLLPVLALALPMAATFERLQSQSMAEAVQQPFLIAAIARGVSRRDLVLASRLARRRSGRSARVYGLVIGALLSGILHRRVRHRVARPRPADVRGAPRARHLPRVGVRGGGRRLSRARAR